MLIPVIIHTLPYLIKQQLESPSVPVGTSRSKYDTRKSVGRPDVGQVVAIIFLSSTIVSQNGFATRHLWM